MRSAENKLTIALEDVGGTSWWASILTTLGSQYGNAQQQFVGQVDGKTRYSELSLNPRPGPLPRGGASSVSKMLTKESSRKNFDRLASRWVRLSGRPAVLPAAGSVGGLLAPELIFGGRQLRAHRRSASDVYPVRSMPRWALVDDRSGRFPCDVRSWFRLVHYPGGPG